jgi:nucleoside-diphosphate-sugar epimerase
MKVFVAGATGALGRPLVRALVARGHEVIGLTRSAEKRRLVESLGARPAVADALDADALGRAVREARPTHVVHLLTALPAEGPLRAGHLRATNALRTRGTANLLRAAIDCRARRVVAESFVGVHGAADFDQPRGEDEPLVPVPRGGVLRDGILAMRALERQLLEARPRIETVVLRYGLFYGPEVASTVALVHRLRRGRMFVPRGASGVSSFIHVDDAAEATVAALESERPSIVYNVVDDEPMALADYVALAAEVFGARPPRTAPVWLVKLVAPVIATAAFARLPLSNAKARVELGWRPAFPTAREGLRSVAEWLREAA